MKKMTLNIIRTIRYPFYQAVSEASEEEFMDDEYKSVWEEAEQVGMKFSIGDRVEIFRTMECLTHFHHNGVDYFYCQDADDYWEELSMILDKKEKE
ncbi:hypothetical protein [Ammoniphilus resinae]|uniref:Allophanate hydrolase subunit 2 n=1 Tax=Ammoniphilus resinae TaxID=861532 RepID=A0ABS4GTD1_9BACL|nr:hypothetical protein [Ammoniphilus resinae]MBP1933504.1 allophanate hydrolase subunit 2 [Ammoniphilus resinae]